MKKVIALDFDGTLCERAWPGIGAPKWPIIRAALEEQRQGALLILWTTREGEALDEALAWCKDVGLNLDVYIAQRNAEAHKICEAARAAYEKAYAKRSAE